MRMSEYITEETYPHFFTSEPYNALVIVAAGLLNVPIYAYQAEILQQVMYHNRVCIVASRQIGKSVSLAILALAWALSQPEQTVLICSTGERQSKELLTKRNYSVKKIFKRAGREATLIENTYEPEDQDVTSALKSIKLPGLVLEFKTLAENAEEVEFSNGSRIICIPANPDTAAGYTANLLIVDECSKIEKWNEMRAALFPFITRVQGKIVISSSFKGKNHFWKMTEDKKTEENPKGWTVLRYPVTVNPPPDLDQIRHDFPEDVFMEEYMCWPIDEAHSLFPYNLIDSCSKGTFEEWPDFLLSI